MAQKKAAGHTSRTKDSAGRRLGVKIFGNQAAKPGAIIVRQRGTKFYPGTNVGMGRDHTIYSLKHGLVKFAYCGKRQTISVVLGE